MGHPRKATRRCGQRSYACVGDSGSGLRVIDVSIPNAPTEIGFIETAGIAVGVAVTGNFAYVADSGDGLRVIDVRAGCL